MPDETETQGWTVYRQGSIRGPLPLDDCLYACRRRQLTRSLRLFQSLFAGAIDDDEFWIAAARQNLHIGEPLGR